MNDLDFTGKIALVTGGLRGIGLEIVKSFASRGATVIIADKNEEQSKKVISLLRNDNLDVEYHYIDLIDQQSCKELVNFIKEKHTTVNILVNNARAGTYASIESETEDSWNQTFDVNLKAPFSLSRSCIDLMKSQETLGTIVNISSVSSFFVSPESPSYQMSKAGVEQLTRMLAVHAGQFDIRVNAISPGFIVQNEHQDRFNDPSNKCWKQTANYSLSLNHVGSSQDVANAALFLSSDLSSFVTGQVLKVDGGGCIQDPFHLLFNRPD